MRFYAAVSGRAEPVVDRRYPHVLVSFALDPALGILRAYTPESLLCDSGAYTAWTKDRAVDVDAYGRWARKLASVHMATFDLRFINLDVIPGKPGREPTYREAADAVYASMANADRLRDIYDLKVMEVFHYGEDGTVLDELLTRRREGEVIGIGGSVGVEHRRRTAWLDELWAHVFKHHTKNVVYAKTDGITARDESEVPPLHGLGTSNEDLARRYPWWSVDSSTYTIPQRFGRRLNRQGRQEFIETPTGQVLRRVKPAQQVEAIRILDRWRRLERDMTRAWEHRGIRYAP